MQSNLSLTVYLFCVTLNYRNFRRNQKGLFGV